MLAWVLDLIHSTGTVDLSAKRCTHVWVVVDTNITSDMKEKTLGERNSILLNERAKRAKINKISVAI